MGVAASHSISFERGSKPEGRTKLISKARSKAESELRRSALLVHYFAAADSSADNLAGTKNLPPGLDGGLDVISDRRGTTATPRLTASPLTLTRATSEAISFRSGGLDGKEWNERQLLVFFDNVRQALVDLLGSGGEKHLISGEDILPDGDPIPSFRMTIKRQQLSNLLLGFLQILDDLIAEEQSGRKYVGIEFIMHTHIDKLLDELLSHVDILGSSPEYKSLPQRAQALKAMWMDRLGISWRLIDSQRLRDMKSTGCHRDLQNMSLPPDWNHDEVGWVVEKVAPGCRAEGSLGLQPGHWWLNMHCCMRDGVVSSPTEPLTRGRYGVTALAMIVGEEIDGRLPDAVVYIREGSKGDMPFTLLGNRQPIRVIRGSRLKSPYAPSVGVRYDGLYQISTFSLKLLDAHQSVEHRYICHVGLHRVPDTQAPFEMALKRPTPSEVDLFCLYWSDVRAGARDALGKERFRAWRCLDVEEGRVADRMGRVGRGRGEMGKQIAGLMGR